MFKAILSLFFAGIAATANAMWALPPDIASAQLCTSRGIHGLIGADEFVQLAGGFGSFDPADAPFTTGQLSHIQYAYDEGVVEGRWHVGRDFGWFRWAFFDASGFYGSWGYGNRVATDERGYWNGQVCMP